MILFGNFIVVAFLGFIVWWFWLYNPRGKKGPFADHVRIVVDKGVYTPNRISAQTGKPLTIEFIRKDPSHCSAEVSFPDFEKSLELSTEKPTLLTLIPTKAGVFEFACPMKMYVGTLVVESAAFEVIVDGGVYIPEEVRVPAKTPFILRFIRKDESHCAETVVFPDFGISELLPTGKPKEIPFPPQEKGTYPFSCAMGMYQGKLIVT